MPPSSVSGSVSRVATLKVPAGLLLICLLALSLGAVGIRNEGYVSLQGDMPRYLANGVYLLDVIKDRPFGSLTDFLEYSRLYYARYPALSLGHHPLLLPFLEVPVFAIAGISVASARVVTLVSFLAAAAFLYLLIWETYRSALAALLASALFVTNTWILTFAQSVLSEMPTIALIVASAFYVRRFCEDQRRGSLAGFAICAALALYAKQLAVFSLLGFGVYLLIRLGVRPLLRRDVLTAAIASALAISPLIPVTLILSRGNVAAVMATVSGETATPSAAALQRLAAVFHTQFTLPVLLLVLASVLVAMRRQDRRVLLPVLWCACALSVLLLTGPMEPDRYTVYAVPPLCMLAAYGAIGWKTVTVRRVAVAAVLVVVAWQARTATARPLPGAVGYEEAAQFVLAADPGATVLFSGGVDTGFFTFFVRKHDPERKLVVLRSDKLLTTSYMTHSDVEERIERPDEIYDILRRYGTRYVVIEDRPSESRVLEWLRQELHSNRFIERKRIPLVTSDRRLRSTSLAIYEFAAHTPPDRNAVFTVHLPLIGRTVSVPLRDLLDRKYLR
jgi:hypothetical protein